jgi:hypothetical protein
MLQIGAYEVVFESKSFEDRTTFNTEQQYRTALRHAASPMAMRQKQRTEWTKWEMTRVRAGNGLARIVRAMSNTSANHALTPTERKTYRSAAQQWLEQYAMLAYKAGLAAAGIGDLGLSAEDEEWLDTKYIRTEWVYLNEFLTSIRLGRAGSLARLRQRAEAYARSLDSVFYTALCGAFPDAGTTIFWLLGPSEHCPDCMRLGQKKRFTPKTLPTTPRAGATRCLYNCRCRLEVRYVAAVKLVAKAAKAGVTQESAIPFSSAIVTDDAVIAEIGIEPSSPIGLLVFPQNEKIP